MKDDKNNGGSAFPFTVDFDGQKAVNTGLSIRDYFAAKAMQGMIANNELFQLLVAKAEKNGKNWDYSLSHNAYDVADAMLKAREQ